MQSPKTKVWQELQLLLLTEIDPTVEEINDIKTAVSEAVTNSIVHGYNEGPGKITLKCKLVCNQYEKQDTYTVSSFITIEIKDLGVGITNIEKAREPLFTTKPEFERSGMGFMFMEMFMNKVDVISEPGKGTTVIMEKNLKSYRKKQHKSSQYNSKLMNHTNSKSIGLVNLKEKSGQRA